MKLPTAVPQYVSDSAIIAALGLVDSSSIMPNTTATPDKPLPDDDAYFRDDDDDDDDNDVDVDVEHRRRNSDDDFELSKSIFEHEDRVLPKEVWSCILYPYSQKKPNAYITIRKLLRL